jgi:hypothetical protein
VKKSFFLILWILAGFLSCKKNAPEIEKLTSEATNFTYTLDEKGGVLISMNAPSQHARYTIDFGEGRKIELNNDINKFRTDGTNLYTRKYYYRTNGSYTITVSASETNRGNTSSSQSITITSVPKTAKITYFKLKDYPDLNPANNSSWDEDDSGPDITYAYQNYTDLTDGGIIGSPYLNASKEILPLQLNIDTISFSVNTSAVNFGCFDDDAPASTNDAITSLYFVIKENTSQGVTYSNGDNSTMYPSTISNNYLEIGIDWIQ